MDQQKFLQHLMQDIYLNLPEEYAGIRITQLSMEKDADISTVLCVSDGKSGRSHRIDTAYYYDAFDSGVSYVCLISELTDRIIECFEEPEDNEMVFDITDYETVKKRIFFQLLRTCGNEELLESVPHIHIEDMSLVYRIDLSEDGERFTSALFSNEMMEFYGIRHGALHDDAVRAATASRPETLRPLGDVIMEMIPGWERGGENLEPELYLASIRSGYMGAAVIMYPGFLDRAAEVLGGAFYILPSSIHEVLLIRNNCTMSPQELRAMVADINRSTVRPEDRLTDNVYEYVSGIGMLREARETAGTYLNELPA